MDASDVNWDESALNWEIEVAKLNLMSQDEGLRNLAKWFTGGRDYIRNFRVHLHTLRAIYDCKETALSAITRIEELSKNSDELIALRAENAELKRQLNLIKSQKISKKSVIELEEQVKGLQSQVNQLQTFLDETEIALSKKQRERDIVARKPHGEYNASAEAILNRELNDLKKKKWDTRDELRVAQQKLTKASNMLKKKREVERF